MKAKDMFGWENEKYAPLRETAKAVVGAYLDANRWTDTVQEHVLIDFGMPNTAKVIHDNAHEFPKRFDSFIDMLHESHLRGEYPATAELTEPIEDMDKAFELTVAALDNVKDALNAFHALTDNDEFRPMALFTESLMQQNSADYTKFLEMWAMWDENSDKAAYDKWAKQFIGGCKA